MRLQYISRDLNIDKSYYEGLALKTNYILSDYMLFHSNLGSFFEMTHDINSFDEKFIINAIAQISEASEEIRNQFIEKNTRLCDKVAFLKKKKSKSKPELIAIQKFNHLIAKFRNNLREINLNMLNLFNIADYYDLFDKDILWGNFLLNEYSEEITEEDCLIEYIHDAIINHDKYFFINPVYFSDYFSIADICTDLITENEEKSADFYSIPLVYIPENINLSIEHIKICRNQILPNFQTLWGLLNDFNKQLPKIQSANDLKSIILDFNKTISYEKKKAQELIDNNSYIQRMINSGDNTNKLNYKIALCTTNTLIDYYEKDNTLLPFVAQSLKELIAKTEDLNSYQMVFYLQFNDLNKKTK